MIKIIIKKKNSTIRNNRIKQMRLYIKENSINSINNIIEQYNIHTVSTLASAYVSDRRAARSTGLSDRSVKAGCNRTKKH